MKNGTCGAMSASAKIALLWRLWVLMHDAGHEIAAQSIETKCGVRAYVGRGAEVLKYNGQGEQGPESAKHFRWGISSWAGRGVPA